MKLELVLRGITDLIVKACDPEAVVLFGSYAKGQENEESDVDIVVISRFDKSPFLRDRELKGLLYRYPIRIDLHMVTPSELASDLAKPHGFLSSAIASGIVLHSRHPDKRSNQCS